MTATDEAGPANGNAPAFPANPFVGLRPFDSDEGLLFFGRREQTIELMQQLHRTRFLAVVGSSGCGKSSLIRAGLIPKLKAGFLVEDRDRWRVATMKPGDGPLHNLASAICVTLVRKPATRELAARAAFTREVDALVEAIRVGSVQAVGEYLTPPLAESDTNLLLLVDQFEEIFRFGLHTDRAERRDEAADFVSIMLALSEQRELPVYVVMTMRSDFIGECDHFYGLPEALNRSLYLVPRLTRQQRQQAIEGPIKLFSQAITPRLLDHVLNDAGEQADQLPVLQHAMMRTWENWQQTHEGPLDWPDYEATGTVKSALSRDADQALAGMGEKDLYLTKRLFQALTDTDVQGRRIRRPARLREIEAITGTGDEKLCEIIELFRGGGRSFLNLTEDRDDPLIDITHESLIRQWGRLQQWVDEEAASREMYLELVKDAHAHWVGRKNLLHGRELTLALDWRSREKPNKAWARRYHPDFPDAIRFLDQSALRRQYKRLARWTVVAAVVIAVPFLLHWRRYQELTQQSRQLEQQRTELIRDIAEQAEVLTEMNPRLAIDQYNKALEVKSDFDPAYFLRGMAYVQQGDLEKAKQDFQRVQQSTANETRRQNAENFLRAIESRLQSAPHYSDTKRQELVAQMFSDNRETRIIATTALLLEWKQDPQLAPAILAMLRAHLTDSSGSNFSKSRGREVDSGYALVAQYNGIVNSLIVLQNLDPQLLRPHEAEITALLKQVENIGPRTNWHADKIRKVLATPPSKNSRGSAG